MYSALSSLMRFTKLTYLIEYFKVQKENSRKRKKQLKIRSPVSCRIYVDVLNYRYPVY